MGNKRLGGMIYQFGVMTAPEIPTPPSINTEELHRSYNDNDPLYITLPIAEIGAVSRDGVYYDTELVNSLAQQINANRPTGIRGHELDLNKHPDPEFIWVAAEIHGNTLWAKAYVPPGGARSEVLARKAAGGKLGTSIFGLGEMLDMDGKTLLRNFQLIRLDVGDQSVVSLQLGGDFVTTKQFVKEEEAIMTKAITIEDVPEEVRKAIIAQFLAEDKEREALEEQIKAEYERKFAEREAQLKAELAQAREDALQAQIKATVAQFLPPVESGESGQKLARIFERALVAEFQGKDFDPERAKEIWDADYKPLAQTLISQIAGGNAHVPRTDNRAADPFGEPLSPEELAQRGLI